MQRSTILSATVALAAGLLGSATLAVNIDLVTVGNPGNAGELSGGMVNLGGAIYDFGPELIVGAVNYEYEIGVFEVTAAQYTEFLNAVAKVDPHGLYNAAMWSGTYGCKIGRNGSSGSYSYSVDAAHANHPVNYVSWADSVRFTNWLSNGQPSTGVQENTTTEDGSYSLNGAMTLDQLQSVTRNPSAVWVIPSEDEWYKAAYHKNDGVSGNYWDYPTRTNTFNSTMANCYGYPLHVDDVGAHLAFPGPYGTFDQGGNIFEWNDSSVSDTSRSCRGGSFYHYSYSMLSIARAWVLPTAEADTVGFRVAYVPEPAMVVLLAIGGIAMMRSTRCNGHP
jgi:sulfatase modifying factor 1